MIVYNYYCLNPECDHKHLQQVRKDASEQDAEEPCIKCEQPMKLMGEAMSGGYAKVQSMTPAQRKKVLLDRSHKHFKKEIEPRKREMNKKFDSEAKQKFQQ